MIRISERRLNYIVKEDNLTIDEFKEKYHITEFSYQYGLKNSGYDVWFEEPKYAAMFKLKYAEYL